MRYVDWEAIVVWLAWMMCGLLVMVIYVGVWMFSLPYFWTETGQKAAKSFLRKNCRRFRRTPLKSKVSYVIDVTYNLTLWPVTLYNAIRHRRHNTDAYLKEFVSGI